MQLLGSQNDMATIRLVRNEPPSDDYERSRCFSFALRTSSNRLIATLARLVRLAGQQPRSPTNLGGAPIGFITPQPDPTDAGLWTTPAVLSAGCYSEARLRGDWDSIPVNALGTCCAVRCLTRVAARLATRSMQVGGQAVLGRQSAYATPWLTERHGYDPTCGVKRRMLLRSTLTRRLGQHSS